MSEIILDSDQKKAVRMVRDGKSVFLTGSAGTGKSQTTTEIIRALGGGRNIAICATTGVAALNLRDKLKATCGFEPDASTIHRWSGMMLGPEENTMEAFEEHMIWMRGDNEPTLDARRKKQRLWQGLQRRFWGTSTIVIDEVSMLTGTALDFVEYLARIMRNSNDPFGGIQVVCVGDFLQLPPVAKDGNYDWAFESGTWKKGLFESAVLKTVHRQKGDDGFVDLLNAFREAKLTKSQVATLNKRVALFPSKDLIRLYTHNAQVDKWNDMQMGRLDGKSHIFEAKMFGPSHQQKKLCRDLITPEVLELKVGARVMITANEAVDGKLIFVNGEMGVVESIDTSDADKPIVYVTLDKGRTVPVLQHLWQYDPKDDESARFIQIPLKLSWACTIHKSQGLTMDEAMIDIRAAREPGQAYVAVSRVRNMAGLHMKDVFTGVQFSRKARKFHDSLT